MCARLHRIFNHRERTSGTHKVLCCPRVYSYVLSRMLCVLCVCDAMCLRVFCVCIHACKLNMIIRPV